MTSDFPESESESFRKTRGTRIQVSDMFWKKENSLTKRERFIIYENLMSHARKN
jgi:hypothetical protein